MRPEKLASDSASKWSVWQHSLKASEEKLGQITAFVDLDCTSPLREDKDIDNILELFFEKNPDMVMSVCDTRKNPYFNMVELRKRVHFTYLSWKRSRGQQAPTVYECAITYVIARSYLRSAAFLYDGNVIPYVMPTERCLDIDSEFDFKIVQFLMKEKYQ